MTQSNPSSNDLNNLIANACREMNRIDNSSIFPLGLANPKAFEFSILLILLDVLNDINGVEDIEYHNLDKHTGRFTVPGAPRLLYSDYSYYSFNYKNSSYEVHMGVQYKGDTSLHEADISIIKRPDAEKSRREHTSPKSKSLVALFECKFYKGSLQIAEARQLVGLKDDLNRNSNYYFISNSTGDSTNTYFSKPDRPNLYANIRFENNNREGLLNFKENIKTDIRNQLVYLERNN